jgi:hypothetical protein
MPSISEFSGAPAATNAGDLTFVASNTGGTRINFVTLMFKDFANFSTISGSGPQGTVDTGQTGQVQASPFSFSMSGQVQIDMWLDTGDILGYVVYRGPSTDYYVKVRVQDSGNDNKWAGTFTAKVRAGQLTSLPNVTFKTVAMWGGENTGSSETVIYTNFGSSRGSSPAAPVNGSGAAPIKYSGPEFSSLSLKPVMNGSSTTLEGRKLDQISSITIDGKAAKLSDATDKSLKLELPAGLKPGVYDLVVNTASHGKLTHMNAIRIREVMPDTSLTIKGSGVLSGEEFKKLTAFARTQNPEMNTATCIVNSNSEGKSFMQVRALCDRIAATNLNIKNTKFEARSTVEGSASFARVVFSSEE